MNELWAVIYGLSMSNVIVIMWALSLRRDRNDWRDSWMELYDRYVHATGDDQ